MKIIVTTSDKYHHIIPIFCYLFNKNWGAEHQVEIVGYKRPEFELPSNFNFISLGVQGDSSYCFSDDLRPYFEKQDDWFIWLFEDTFIIDVNHRKLDVCKSLTSYENVGRINLTRSGLSQDHVSLCLEQGYDVYSNTQESNYRLSTQPSIWNKKFLLQYLTRRLSPWRFEVQGPINDGWNILGLYDFPIVHNEGVRRNDIHAYNLSGISEEQLSEMKKMRLI